jgi:serine/threonine protein kinase
VLGQEYTHLCDVWTMGIMYYELLTGNIPGKGRDDEARIKDIMARGIVFPADKNISQASK